MMLTVYMLECAVQYSVLCLQCAVGTVYAVVCSLHNSLGPSVVFSSSFLVPDWLWTEAEMVDKRQKIGRNKSYLLNFDFLTDLVTM